MTEKRCLTRTILTWLPPAIWLGIIVFFSAQSGEDSASLSLGLAEYLRKLLGGKWDVETVHYAVRKTAHFGIFAVEGFLLTMALRRTGLHAGKAAWVCALTCGALAALNEYQQTFSVDRGPSVLDALIDFGGALAGIAVGLLLFAAFRRTRNKKSTKIRGR